MAGNNTFCPIRNISKETGEIKERKKSVSRYQTPKSVRKSINKLMDFIRCNATKPTHCKCLTLIPMDWEEVDTELEEVYLYQSQKEKESLILKDWEETNLSSVEELFQEIMGEKSELDILQEMVELQSEEGKIYTLFCQPTEETVAYLFIWKREDVFLQGCFQIHPYRRKVWEPIFPQILQQMKRINSPRE